MVDNPDTTHPTDAANFIQRASLLHIRPAVIGDAESLGALWRETVDTLARLDRRLRIAPDGVEQWRRAFISKLAQPEWHSVVALRGQSVIASMTGQIIDNQPGFLPEKLGLVTELIVDSHGRGGGIGTQLYQTLGTWFIAQGISQVEARVPASNPIAQAFWRASGASDLYQYLRLRTLTVTTFDKANQP